MFRPFTWSLALLPKTEGKVEEDHGTLPWFLWDLSLQIMTQFFALALFHTNLITFAHVQANHLQA